MLDPRVQGGIEGVGCYSHCCIASLRTKIAGRLCTHLDELRNNDRSGGLCTARGVVLQGAWARQHGSVISGFWHVSEEQLLPSHLLAKADAYHMYSYI